MSETLRRKREIFSLVPILLIFISLTWFQFRLFAISDKLPFYYAIFFFGLVNLNLIVFLILLFLIFKNLVKLYSESKIPIFGRTLKAKLIIAFFTFAFVPTFLMFLVSIFYINSSFDRWFALKGMGILDDSIQISEIYYKNLKKEGYYFSSVISNKLRKNIKLNKKLKEELISSLQDTSVDALEIYTFSDNSRWLNIFNSNKRIKIPELNPNEIEELRKKGLESTSSVDIKEGRLLRTFKVSSDDSYMVVVNRLIPSFLADQINNIIEARDEYRGSTPFEFPLKTIYLITLILMTLVILLGGTWFGLYLAGQLSVSLELLGQATREIAKGKYETIEISTGSYEVERLVKNFNLMSKKLQQSTEETVRANDSLTKTLVELQESKNYIETIVENISTAIITINENDEVTFLNRAAKNFFKFNGVKDSNEDSVFMPEELFAIYQELKQKALDTKTAVQTQERRLTVNGKSYSLNCALSVLLHDNQDIIGFVFGFEDVTVLAKAQRAEAWAEVATRVAHEIKNPLTPIKLSAERLQKKYPNIDTQTFDQCTQMIIQQVDIVKNLVNEFSYHARLPKINLERGSLVKIIEDTIWVYKQKLKNLEIDFVILEDIKEIYFDHEQIKRTIINLLDNAIDACRNVADPQIKVQIGLTATKDYIRVSISDNGPGVSEADMDKVFLPNYTTKTSGMGLGLSIVKKMIEEHGGVLGLERQDSWTTFYFTLPIKL